MTNEKRAVGIAFNNTSLSIEGGKTLVALLKAAGLLAPDPEPKYRRGLCALDVTRGGVGVLIFYTDSTDAERACVLAALNAMEEK